MCNYLEEMKDDIRNYLNDAAWKENIEDFSDIDDFRNHFYDDMFVSDAVTGNASGSYTFNRYEAKENVIDNMDLLKKACEEFCCMEILGEKFINEEWEWMDVTIRCYLLSQALQEVIEEDELEEALENALEELELIEE